MKQHWRTLTLGSMVSCVALEPLAGWVGRGKPVATAEGRGER